jgi:hypothetical protein
MMFGNLDHGMSLNGAARIVCLVCEAAANAINASLACTNDAVTFATFSVDPKP